MRHEQCPECGLVLEQDKLEKNRRCPRCFTKKRRVPMEQLVIRLASESDRFRLGRVGNLHDSTGVEG
jgi:hypothetical protein